jgi:hypothetical protein
MYIHIHAYTCMVTYVYVYLIYTYTYIHIFAQISTLLIQVNAHIQGESVSLLVTVHDGGERQHGAFLGQIVLSNLTPGTSMSRWLTLRKLCVVYNISCVWYTI